jgi:hypothetical protein
MSFRMDYDMCYTGGCNRAVNRSWEWRHAGECSSCGSRCNCQNQSWNCQGPRKCLKYYPGDYLYGETMTRHRDGYDYRYSQDYQHYHNGDHEDKGKKGGKKINISIDLGDGYKGKKNDKRDKDSDVKWNNGIFNWREH